jgi:retron-type reverse transcriptase
MGNRTNRSTETALELLVEQIHTVWKTRNQVASVLSLDIARAFDTVNHLRLLDNLRKKGVPLWFIRTVRSFLTDRTTTLLVDNEETAPRQLNAGVPQGSPLSLILFLFYNAPLLEALDQPDLPLSPLGFADDVNLLTYREDTVVNCTNLEAAHEQCLEWARTHGMRFAPNKYTLTHFTRR